MSRHYPAITLIIFLLMGIPASCIKKSKLGWQGSIEEINGITTINNPNEPLYGELVFDLEEDLSIGNVQNENYLFSMVLGIEKDRGGNIYVLEAGKISRIQKFSSEGKYLCAFGGMGQGPGEFQAPSQILIDDKNSFVAIKDIWRLLVFDAEGNYLNSDIAFGLSVLELWIDSQSSLWGIVSQTQSDAGERIRVSKAFVNLNRSGQVEKVFDSYPYKIFTERRASGIAMIGGGVEFDLHASSLNGQGFVYGNSDKYELNVIGLDGKLVCKIRKEAPFQYFTSAERNRSAKIRFAEYKPFFYRLLSDNEGRIYVQKNNARLTDPGEKEFDIFSKDGIFLYHTICPMTPFVIDNGFFYTRIENNETGDVLVKRFKIKYWDKIKKAVKNS